jgi:phytanoyl-CoA hydroxylase
MIDAAAYRETGSVLVPRLFAEDRIDALRADAWRVFRRQLERHGLIGPGEPSETELNEALFAYFREHTAEFANCGKQIQHLVSLHQAALDGRVMEILAGLGLDDPNVAIRPVVFFNHPRLAREQFYWKTPPHQDWRSMQGSLDSVVAWVALVDVDERLGALEVVPGSHRRGLLAERFVNGFGETAEFADEDFTAVPMAKGDALFFSSFLVHRSGTNVTDALRWSAQFRYNNLAEATFVARGYPHSFIYKAVDELMTPGFPGDGDLARVFG